MTFNKWLQTPVGRAWWCLFYDSTKAATRQQRRLDTRRVLKHLFVTRGEPTEPPPDTLREAK